MMGALTAIGSGLAISAALIYVLLRFLVAEPSASNATAAISRHAFWTALIAFLASGTSGLSNLWANPGENLFRETGSATTSVPTLIMHAAAPGLWLGIVYILGQFTWPRHLKPVRAASLEVRRLKTLVPRFLAGFLLLCTAISTVLIIVAWNDSGVPDRVGNQASMGMELPIYDGGTDGYGNPVDTDGNLLDLDDPEGHTTRAEADEPAIWPITGTRPGDMVGPYLLGGLGLVLLGSLGAATAVVRRPPLDSLDAEENAVLRAIWINRLLRTTIFAVTGFGMAALGYVAEGMRARADWGIPLGDAGSHFDSTAQDQANAMNGIATIWMLLVLVLIVAFGPPKLDASASFTGRRPGAPSASFSKARDFLLLAQGASVIAVAMLGLLPSWTASSSTGSQVWEVVDGNGDEVHRLVSSDGPAQLDELGGYAVTMLLVIAGYFLVQGLAAWIVSRRLGSGVALGRPRTDLLPTWFVVVLCLAATTGVASIATFLLAGPPALAAAAWWLLGILLLAAALTWGLYRMAARRPVLRGASGVEDDQLRVLVAQRGARTFGGASFIIAGILGTPGYWVATDFGYVAGSFQDPGPSGFQITCLVLGVALCLLPASTAYRPALFDTPDLSLSNH
ncbi:hypothetical protein GCM10009715_17140 [Paeniglutamicibacter psychrophenolicus]|uniref:Cbb3-type cytochrome oxidase subunit 3 n=1 Tax=Paeniglutamicibacter psychrophenolicus TaxID=257454 RepID=A0ABS4WDH1_9MICC|nr:hypothetical protein [Paeniglutamicibacter psychrophenolicus]MBP2373958.1 cbb3-type cytochrome oxidase subunit 3 [Paeniglutamicibacter psychrophenolicus]